MLGLDQMNSPPLVNARNGTVSLYEALCAVYFRSWTPTRHRQYTRLRLSERSGKWGAHRLGHTVKDHNTLTGTKVRLNPDDRPTV